MPTFQVNVRWGKQFLKDIKVNTDENPRKLKDALSVITGVKPTRQKLMVSGTSIKDDSWDQLRDRLKDGMTLLMMGTRDEDLASVEASHAPPTASVSGPTTATLSSSSDATGTAATRAMADGSLMSTQKTTKGGPRMDASENMQTTWSDESVARRAPRGLVNLGNTCYLNATVQCLYTVPELREALAAYYPTSHPPSAAAGSQPGAPSRPQQQQQQPPQSTASQNDDVLVTSALKVCFNELDPLNGGMRKLLISQQGNDDADQDLAEEEGYSPKPLLAALHRRLPHFAAKTSTGVFMQQDANECWTEVMRILQEQLRSYNIQGSDLNDHHRDTVTKYFRGHLESRFSCDECKEEPETKTVESFLQLSCFINAEVKYLLLGLRSRFKPETITKRSATLGRNAVYTRKSAITRLPAYLTVQLVRFHYKEKEKINAKILRDVAFPLRLDVYEFCSDELKKKLDPPRAKLTELINASVFTPTKTNKGKGSDDGEDGGRRSKRNRVMKRSSFADDPGASDTGIYDLQAVLTHQGRSSQSGHYVGWVSPRDAPGRPGRYAKTDWFKMNDDVVTPVEEAEILKLSGGGDWHCAYVLLYGPPVE